MSDQTNSPKTIEKLKIFAVLLLKKSIQIQEEIIQCHVVARKVHLDAKRNHRVPNRFNDQTNTPQNLEKIYHFVVVALKCHPDTHRNYRLPDCFNDQTNSPQNL